MLRRLWNAVFGVGSGGFVEIVYGPTAEQAREAAGYFCPECKRPIDTFSAENDYICDVHGFVNPVRFDGAVICGDGHAGPAKVIRWVEPPSAS